MTVVSVTLRPPCLFPSEGHKMFVSLRRTQTWRLHTKLYKFEWHTSANNARMKNSRDLILGKVVYISIICRISDSWLFSLHGYDFYFDHMTGESREFISATSPKCIGFAGSGHMVRNKLCWDANNAVGLSKKWQVGMDWKDFFFGSPTVLLTSQHNLFRTMWPDRHVQRAYWPWRPERKPRIN